MYYVYILQGENKYYVGYTSNLDRRINEHKEGQSKYSKSIHIYKLVGYFKKETRSEAIILENIIKRDGHIQHWIKHKTFVLIDKTI